MKNNWLRTVYLYLFALVGLAMITVGAARLVDLGLKMFIFTQADNDYYSAPPSPAS